MINLVEIPKILVLFFKKIKFLLEILDVKHIKQINIICATVYQYKIHKMFVL